MPDHLLHQLLVSARNFAFRIMRIDAQTWDELAVIMEPKKRFNTDLKELFSEMELLRVA